MHEARASWRLLLGARSQLCGRVTPPALKLSHSRPRASGGGGACTVTPPPDPPRPAPPRAGFQGDQARRGSSLARDRCGAFSAVWLSSPARTRPEASRLLGRRGEGRWTVAAGAGLGWDRGGVEAPAGRTRAARVPELPRGARGESAGLGVGRAVAGRARPLRRGREPGKRPAASPGSHRRPSSSWLWTEGLQVSAGLSGLETGLASSRLGVLGGWRELLDSSPWAAVSEALFCVLGSRRPVGNPAGCKRRGALCRSLMNPENPPPYPGPGPTAPYPPYPQQPMGPVGGPYPPPPQGYPYQGYPQYGWQGGPQEPPKTTVYVVEDQRRDDLGPSTCLTACWTALCCCCLWDMLT
ncbi:cysteine-rich and transmembrane domain-containing protein 1 [Castor canadensis]|uniref:Cysteine-rich and transmembrane domain-containing protein 1 n=2 Tax=Castor canadensis TaxID=51338 RepID=A0AC58MX37_CASCN